MAKKRTYQIIVVVETTFSKEIEASDLKEARAIASEEWYEAPDSFEQVETELQRIDVDDW